MQAVPKRETSTDHKLSIEDLALELSMARGIDEVMAVIRTHARNIVGADGITFVLRDGDQCFYADEDAISPLWKGQRFPLSACVSGWAMLHREMVVIEDIYADDRVPHAAYRATFVKSMVMTPVRRDDPVAAIGAYWRRRRRPTANELRTLRWIANSAAVALTNVALYESLKSARDEAVRAREATVLAMASLAATRDNETANHVRRTQQFIKILAEAALARGLYSPELDAGQVDLIVKSAPLHDIGKIGIPDRILQKPGRLDPEELEVMKTHTEMGRDALATAERHLGMCTPFFQTAQEIAYCHHERWDGSGYPRGLRGADIPLSGRFMALVDVYDALVSERVYKKGMSHADAVAIIAGETGRHFDPTLVEVFLEVEAEFAETSRFLGDE